MRFRLWLRRLSGLAAIPAVVVALACSFTLSPETARNPVGDEHTVFIDIIATFELAPGFLVNANWTANVAIIDGPNTGESGTCSPSCSGSGDANVTWTYESNGEEGTDTIQVCVDFEDPGPPSCDTVTKRWVDPSTPSPTATNTPTVTPSPTPTATPDARPNVGGIFGPLPNRNLTPAAPPPAAAPPPVAPTFEIRPPSTGDAGAH
jgi:hypothetical protein